MVIAKVEINYANVLRMPDIRTTEEFKKMKDCFYRLLSCC